MPQNDRGVNNPAMCRRRPDLFPPRYGVRHPRTARRRWRAHETHLGSRQLKAARLTGGESGTKLSTYCELAGKEGSECIRTLGYSAGRIL